MQPTPRAQHQAEHVRLRLPAEPAFGRIARLTASGLALRHGFDHGEVEALRGAIEAAIGLLVRPPVPVTPDGGPTADPDDRLAVTFVLEPATITVGLRREFAAEGSYRLAEGDWAEFAGAVGGLVDAVTVEPHAAQVQLVKRRSTD